MSVLTKEQLLEFKNQIKDAIMLSVKDSKKIPTLDISKSIAICDRLNSNVNLGARAEKTLRKLSLQKDNAIAINALRLADMVVKNCPRFRPLLNTKTFSSGLVKSLPKRIRDPQGASFHSMTEAPEAEVERYNKALLLIQSWAKIMHNWKAAYDDLVKKNCQFPEPMKDEVSPLDYDDKKVPAKNTAPTSSTDFKVVFTDSECKKAAGVIEVLELMLRAQPEEPAKDPIIQELKQQVEVSQRNVRGRLPRESNPLVMNQLLKANDMLNDIMQMYKDVLAGKPLPEKKTESKKSVKKENTKSEDKKSGKEKKEGKKRKPKAEKKKEKPAAATTNVLALEEY